MPREENLMFAENNVRAVCLQRSQGDSPECSAVRVGTHLASPRMDLRVAEAPGREIDEMPVGTVAYVLGGLSARGIRQPDPIDYPESLRPYLRRRVERASLGEVLGQDAWIKHAGHDKPFMPGLAGRDDLRALDPQTPVFASEPVRWLCEWRCYVAGGRLLWRERYDPDGADDAPEPSPPVIDAMIAAYQASGEAPAGYGIDIGILDTGETAIVEANDGYALGYYGSVDTLKSGHYLRLLVSRYEEIAGLREFRRAPCALPAQARH